MNNKRSMSILAKRKRGRPRLDESREINDFDANLLAAVKKYPIFYDKNHPQHRSKENVDHVWNLVANSLKVPVKFIKKRMFQLRNRYNVEKSRSLTTWPLFDNLKYLSEYSKNRTPSMPAVVNMAENEASSTDAEDEDDQDIDEVHTENFEDDINERNGSITIDNIYHVEHNDFRTSPQPATEVSNIPMAENTRVCSVQDQKIFKAFGDFLASSLIELNERQALQLIKMFTIDLVEVEEGNKPNGRYEDHDNMK